MNMKTPNLYTTDIQASIKYVDSSEFSDDLILQNIRRGRPLAMIVIAFETAFLLVDLTSFFLKVNSAFSFYSYLAMYSGIIAINLAYLFLIKCFSQKKVQPKAMNTFTVLYLTLVMAWGSVVSLMDQKLYGQLMTFMVNMMVCSVIYVADAKKMSVPFLTSALILSIGLPFFQKAGNVLIGHYVNLAVFVVISWTSSRFIYRNYCDGYVIKELMKQSNLLLEKEMEENRIINEKLAISNAQLKNLALADELTGLPNRRNFREFLDKVFQAANAGLPMSVLMIDIDNFKQYNDFYGHDNGDLTLIAVAKQINSMARYTDQIAVRWGGEEFVYAAFNKSREDAIQIAEDIRLKILDMKIPNQSSLISPYITISLGTCTGTLKSTKEISKIIKAADQALYMAKNAGRNRVATSVYNESSDGGLLLSQGAFCKELSPAVD